MPESADLNIVMGEKTVTTAGTRERLVTGDRADVAMLTVTIKALTTNTDKVYVGDHTVASTNGFDLDPGDALTLTTDSTRKAVNLAKIYLDSAQDGEGVRYIALRD